VTGADWGVIAAGAAAIAWVNWYFFLARRPVAEAHAAANGGAQEITIRVQGGYEPSEVRVEAGKPVRLIFDRQETSSCSEEVVLPDFGVRRFLPAFQKTAIEVTPERPGSYEFTCGMSMLHGRLVAEG
jgi:plastocyanin domain-containing protein